MNKLAKTSTNTHKLDVSRVSDDKIIKSFLAFGGKKTSTQELYRRSLKQFFTILGCGIKEVDVLGITEYFSFLTNTYKPATAKNKMSAVKSLFSFLVRVGYVEANPTVRFTHRKEKSDLVKKVVDQDVLKKFLDSTKSEPLYHKLFSMLYLTGARISELLNLKWGDINGNKISLNGKTGERIVAINPAFLKVIEKLKGRSEYVFCSRNGTKLASTNVYAKLQELAKKSGIDHHFTPHTFRHNCATHLLQNGMKLNEVQAFLGHSNIATTSIYLKFTEAPSSEKYLHF